MADDLVRLTRADLVATVDAYRAAKGATHGQAPTLGVVAGIFVGVAGVIVSVVAGLPFPFVPGFFVGGWVLAFTFGFLLHRRQMRRLRGLSWNCPGCSAPMLPATAEGNLTRAETAVATGRCPVCGENLFE